MLKTLLFSTLYPSSARPVHGIFVETRLRELLARGGLQVKVVAPVPWFPSTDTRHGKYAAMAATPPRETRHGIDVLHPRYAVIPKIGMNVAPFFLAAAARGALKQLQREGHDFDLIDAHYYYPDGVAAALLGAWFRKPVVITARGTDVNLIPEYRVPRQLVRWAASRAQASIGVSQALVDRMRALGMPTRKLHVMRNGVDTGRFVIEPQEQARLRLGLRGAPLLLTVGNLHEHKGQRLVVQTLKDVRLQHPQARLVVVGDGPDRAAIVREIEALGLADAVTMVGAVANTELSGWYSAADVLLLASSREGWPNVLLESMACGTPVVASGVGGVPEIVQSSLAGRVVQERTGAGFARATLELLDELRTGENTRLAVRAYAQGFSWDQTSQAQLALFQALAQGPGSAAS